MANFDPAFIRTYSAEGIYDNDPNDTGGETCGGVSRNNFPTWEGWRIVDHYKTTYVPGSGAFMSALKADTELYNLTKTWYKENFWDKFDCDSLTYQPLAEELFDQAVNHGVGRATTHIQRAFNAFNYNLKFGADLLVDGKIGPNTRSKLVQIGNDQQYSDVFRKALDAQQGAFYIELGNKPLTTYRKYMRGWFINRVG